MKCPNCGEKLENGARYCNKCAAIFPKPLYEERELDRYTEEDGEEKEESTRSHADKPNGNGFLNMLFYLISAFMPIMGVIFYFVLRKKNPKVAKLCLIIATMLFAISLIINTVNGLF